MITILKNNSKRKIWKEQLKSLVVLIILIPFVVYIFYLIFEL